MGENNTEADGQNDAQDTAQTEINRFSGFSAKDGVREEPSPNADDQAADKGAKAKVGDGDNKADKEGDSEKHRSAQSRIDKAVGAQRRAERERDSAIARADRLERRLDEIEARLTGGGNGATPANKDDKEPNPKDYQGGEFDTRYIRDLARYEARQEASKSSAQSRETAKTEQQRAAAVESQRRIEEFAEKASETYEDFAEVVFDESNRFSTTIVELSLESEFGAQIAYELANDPKEQRRLAALSPAQQARWFAKREIELSSTAQDADGEGEGNADPGAAKRPKAPPPPKHQTRGNGGSSAVNAATSDFSAFERMAMGQNRRQ